MELGDDDDDGPLDLSTRYNEIINSNFDEYIKCNRINELIALTVNPHFKLDNLTDNHF